MTRLLVGIAILAAIFWWPELCNYYAKVNISSSVSQWLVKHTPNK